MKPAYLGRRPEPEINLSFDVAVSYWRKRDVLSASFYELTISIREQLWETEQ